MNSLIPASWVLVPCNECGGAGKLEVIAGNSPYDMVIDCEACDGEGEILAESIVLKEVA